MKIAKAAIVGEFWQAHDSKEQSQMWRCLMEGKGAVSVTVSQQIELTGVMKTVREKGVFLVRSVKTNGKTSTIRNEHGVDVPPQASERADKKGVTL